MQNKEKYFTFLKKKQKKQNEYVFYIYPLLKKDEPVKHVFFLLLIKLDLGRIQ